MIRRITFIGNSVLALRYAAAPARAGWIARMWRRIRRSATEGQP